MNVRFKAIIGHVGFTVASKQITKVMNIRSITYERDHTDGKKVRGQ